MKRVIKTFEPDPDVAAMLERTELCGFKLVFLCNQALREYLTERGFARKGDPTPRRTGK